MIMVGKPFREKQKLEREDENTTSLCQWFVNVYVFSIPSVCNSNATINGLGLVGLLCLYWEPQPHISWSTQVFCPVAVVTLTQ